MRPTDRSDPLGATLGRDGVARFVVWAPRPRAVRLVLDPAPATPPTLVPLGDGYFGAEVPDVAPGTRYGYRLDGGRPRPDPASRSQPDGVHGLSAVVAPERFAWTDAGWKGVPPERWAIYETHVGTFSPAGTFEGLQRRLGYLAEVGVTVVELMPIAQFPGARNWGYDGVYPYAVQASYGGIAGLQRLADAAHARGLALFVDVVYNHLGPEGNYLGDFGPYFTDRYRTPWGLALNFDGPGSDEVRRFFLESARWLLTAGHVDGLRVDAVHAIVDPTARPFLAELTDALGRVGAATRRRRYAIAESALNDPRVVEPVADGGLGFDAMWNDDFHHAVHVALTGERHGYFADFAGAADLARVWTDGFVLAGGFSAWRGRRHGAPATGVPAERFVVFAQNHDQVGNRPFGERLARLVSLEAQKLALGVTLLGPYVPQLFMGEEYGETAPFLYFTSHSDPRLAKAVRDGRRSEFAADAGDREVPDPQAARVFARSRLDLSARFRRPHRTLLALTSTLLALRRAFLPPRRLGPDEVGGPPGDARTVWIDRRRADPVASLAVFRVGPEAGTVRVPAGRRRLELRVASAAERWGGSGPAPPSVLHPGRSREVPLGPWSFVFYAAR